LPSAMRGLGGVFLPLRSFVRDRAVYLLWSSMGIAASAR
jgi:hypothetical protein